MNETRNIAVIAHVDHGKTTLVDALLKQTHVFRENQEEMGQSQILDSNELERERGITILAKNCAINYKNTKINIIDTPGHSDFSGEVERTLGMADGALLIVDAQEGPMPQTRFVLKTALSLGLKIIVVVNKIDKKNANPKATVSKIESLFLELSSDESMLDFPVLFAVGRRGAVFTSLPEDLDTEGNVIPLLDEILSFVPKATVAEGVFKMLVSSIEYDNHLGKMVIGKIAQGKVKKGAKVILTRTPNKVWTVEEIFTYEGLSKVKTDEALSGDIVCLAGIREVNIGETLSDPGDTNTIPSAMVSEPTLHITLGANTSPLGGREGEFTTSRQLEERLNRELESNLGLRVSKQDNGKFVVSGRGELHLTILLETMRREGYEMEVGKPEVVTKHVDGKEVEPVEEVSIIVPETHVGVISEEMGKRYATLISMSPNDQGEVEFIYRVPTRALIGLRGQLLTMTKGTVVINSTLVGFEPIGKPLPRFRKGVIVSDRSGEALGYGLENAQQRGITFIDPGAKVYEGMIIGASSREEDVLINPTKGKKLTNMRSKSSDGVLQLTPATKFSLERSLDFLENEELLEITPESLRLRKKHLSELERKRSAHAARS